MRKQPIARFLKGSVPTLPLVKVHVSERTLKIALELIDLTLESGMPDEQKAELADAARELRKAVEA